MSENLPSNGRAAASCMIAAMFVVGCIDNFIVFIAETVSIWQFQALRAAIALPLILGLSAFGAGSILPKRFWAVLLRSLFLTISMLFYFGSLAFMPMAQALAGLFTSPIFVLLITALVLGEKIGPIRVIAVSLGFLGILLVLNKGLIDLNIISFLPVLGGVFYALAAVATRQLCEGESTLSLLTMLLVLQFLFGLGALIYLGMEGGDVAPGADGFLTRPWTWSLAAALPWIIIQAVGSILGIGLIFRAYQIGQASYVAVFEYSAFIFGPFFAWLFIGQQIQLLQVAGIACIAAAGVLIARRTL